jgi:hypothetical protein
MIVITVIGRRDSVITVIGRRDHRDRRDDSP